MIENPKICLLNGSGESVARILDVLALQMRKRGVTKFQCLHDYFSPRALDRHFEARDNTLGGKPSDERNPQLDYFIKYPEILPGGAIHHFNLLNCVWPGDPRAEEFEILRRLAILQQATKLGRHLAFELVPAGGETFTRVIDYIRMAYPVVCLESRMDSGVSRELQAEYEAAKSMLALKVKGTVYIEDLREDVPRGVATWVVPLLATKTLGANQRGVVIR